MSLTENIILQKEEIEALSAIFGNDWKLENENGKIFSINVSDDKKNIVKLQVSLTEGYPLTEPPIYEISAPWLKRNERSALCRIVESTYSKHVGESIVFLWIDKIREFLEGFSVQNENNDTFEEAIETELNGQNETNDETLLTIKHGDPITDRRSTFQAHLATVFSAEQVKSVMNELLQNRKIASATHNVSAYRIYVESRKSYIQDCDDDGETHAGSRLLHLLQILDVSNVVVVVSRWFGGIQLGPDRFKHINNVARDLLNKQSLIVEEKNGDLTKGKKTKKAKEQQK